MRVGFVELGTSSSDNNNTDGHAVNGSDTHTGSSSHRYVKRLLERSWPIDEHLKNENPDSLFLWIGKCIAEVVHDGCETLRLPLDQAMPLGVTFSFPMVQHSLSEATLMSMGKGFAISADLDLGDRLTDGYNRAKPAKLPPIRVEAIANDSVSTLVSFIFNFDEAVNRRASMGLILGTGCNATIPLKVSQLHPSKRPRSVVTRPDERAEGVKIAINTEWSINGPAPPLHEVGLVSAWDKVLDSENELPGFQPLEYMTAGRYLGELGRIMLVDYMTKHLGIEPETLPVKLLRRHGLTTTFLSHFKPLRPSVLLAGLREEFPRVIGVAAIHVDRRVGQRPLPDCKSHRSPRSWDSGGRDVGVAYAGGGSSSRGIRSPAAGSRTGSRVHGRMHRALSRLPRGLSGVSGPAGGETVQRAEDGSSGTKPVSRRWCYRSRYSRGGSVVVVEQQDRQVERRLVGDYWVTYPIAYTWSNERVWFGGGSRSAPVL